MSKARIRTLIFASLIIGAIGGADCVGHYGQHLRPVKACHDASGQSSAVCEWDMRRRGGKHSHGDRVDRIDPQHGPTSRVEVVAHYPVSTWPGVVDLQFRGTRAPTLMNSHVQRPFNLEDCCT